MLERVAIAAGIAVAAVVIAWVVRKRRSSPRPINVPGHLPAQLDRNDFAGPTTEWLVVVFTSSSCHTCEDVVGKAEALRSPHVEVVEAEFTRARHVHERYGIDAVPATVVCDVEGVVRAGFLGPVTATDLWAAVAEARQPGTTPEPGLGKI